MNISPMQEPQNPPKPSPAKATKAARDAAEATALRANLQRRKAQARAATTPAPKKEDDKCP
ncbi:MAG: hypothetical protein P4L52_04350 [Acidocella sp.]|nr:hypothetical protein [Acidocella sp.]